jgi:hypothetical protein
MGKGVVKLGEGQWAVKDGNLLAAKETNGRFKNAEFTVARGTRATYVGRDGLIKESNLQDVNLITNGTFDTDSDWTKGTGWSISNGKARRSGHSVNSDIRQYVPVVNGGLYKFSYTRSYESGEGVTNIYVQLDNANYSTLGNYSSTVVEEHTVEGYFTTTFTGNLLFRIFGINDFTGTIDNISVQEIKTDTPRIDFADNTDGHLLLEPQSTNLITYSEDFSQWAGLIALSIGLNQGISPNGSTEANLLSIGIDSSSTRHRLYNTFNFVLGDTYTYSVFAKKNENDWFQLMFSASAFDNESYANFDLNNGLVGNKGTSTTANIMYYGNGWYRCSITCTASASVTTTYEILTTNNTNSGRYPSYQSSAAVNVCFLWGAQLEVLSYATSYIPTSGSTVTRDAETCTGAGEAADFNSEEGVLYAEIAALADDGTNRCIALSDGTADDRVTLVLGDDSNKIRAIVKSDGSTSFDEEYTVTSTLDYHKVAIKYKANDFALWIDGVERFTDTSGSAPIGLNELAFDTGISILNLYGKCKALRVYKEALSDTDLQNLTS